MYADLTFVTVFTMMTKRPAKGMYSKQQYIDQIVCSTSAWFIHRKTEQIFVNYQCDALPIGTCYLAKVDSKLDSF